MERVGLGCGQDTVAGDKTRTTGLLCARQETRRRLDLAIIPRLQGPSYLQPFQTMLQTANIARELVGVQTDVLLQAFADRIVVLVTQLGKVGSLVSGRSSIPSIHFLLCC